MVFLTNVSYMCYSRTLKSALRWSRKQIAFHIHLIYLNRDHFVHKGGWFQWVGLVTVLYQEIKIIFSIYGNTNHFSRQTFPAVIKKYMYYSQCLECKMCNISQKHAYILQLLPINISKYLSIGATFDIFFIHWMQIIRGILYNRSKEISAEVWFMGKAK